ncbi:hypothetical protein VNI00_013408 [Paramarasmius palmivorus]|uniref:Uncharacterized protein n=1 Tax=Paramarasmius palmivorus TaxID=297713 RepID=A0AAW0C196_9AGAR
MMAVTDLNAMMKQQKESMERAIALMEVEGLQVAQEYGNLLSRMSQVCGAAQNREGARRYKKLYDTFVRATKSVKNSTIAKKEEGSKKLHEEMQQQMTEHMATMGYQAQQAWK